MSVTVIDNSFLTLFFVGVESTTKTSSQIVDSGQLEDTRWSDTGPDVVKVRFFSLRTGETGDIIRQLRDKVANRR